MGLSKNKITVAEESTDLTTAKKRRLRRKKLRAARVSSVKNNIDSSNIGSKENTTNSTVPKIPITQSVESENHTKQNNIVELVERKTEMSSKESTEKSRNDVLANREAKKLAKQKAKRKDEVPVKDTVNPSTPKTSDLPPNKIIDIPKSQSTDTKTENKKPNTKSDSPKSKDEVDRAVVHNATISHTDNSKEHVKAERAAKKAAKQSKKKPTDGCDKLTNNNDIKTISDDIKAINEDIKAINDRSDSDKVINDMTVKDVVNTLKDIVNVAKEVQAVTDKVIAIDFGNKKPEEATKSKAELRAERRAKQEAQRAAKQAAPKQAEVKQEPSKKPLKPKEEKQTKPKAAEKPKPKSQSLQKMNWFQHLHTKHDKESLKQMAINSNLHPAVIKLGVQQASHVVTGSNARCIALLDALKKMVRDYSLPARTEFARGLESQVAASAEFLWAMRPPAASQTNALKSFRHHLTQLPNNVDEFDAKKVLQEEIDRYIREQIDKAGEAISLAIRGKISDGDNILTYGCSSLVERIISEAHAAGVRFRAVVVGTRMSRSQELLRRLTARGVTASYADISALSALMRNINKVLVGAAALLVNGAVLAPVGTLQAALVARAHNVPLLVACESHKFADTVQTDAFVYNEIGDPDDLIDKTDENSPLKDWRSNPNLTLLNLLYDVTPPSLVTAVVTELGILPCTSAPVVVRYKLSEYGM